MTLDQEIRSTLARAASDVPFSPTTAIDVIRDRSRRRVVRRRALVGVGCSIVFLGALVLAVPFDPNPISPATSPDVDTVEIADLAVAVTTEEPVTTDPDVWVGLPGPAPVFDTSELGPNLSFTPGEPMPGDLDEAVSRAVYLGELDGEAVYLYSKPAPSIWDRIFEIVDGNFSGDVLGTSLECCTGGNMDHEGGLPMFSYGYSSEDGVITDETIVAEWLGLATNVSVVAYQFDGEFVGWQRPVGGASGIIPDSAPTEINYIAFDAQGRELDRYQVSFDPMAETSTPSPVPSLPGDDWAPLASDGEAIEAADIHDEALLASIDPQPDDLLFRVTLEGDELIVRVRDQQPHVFAQSCDTLKAIEPPPGWPSTCLE